MRVNINVHSARELEEVLGSFYSSSTEININFNPVKPKKDFKLSETADKVRMNSLRSTTEYIDLVNQSTYNRRCKRCKKPTPNKLVKGGRCPDCRGGL